MSDQYGSGNPGDTGSSAWNGPDDHGRHTEPTRRDASPHGGWQEPARAQESRPMNDGGTYPDSAYAGTPQTSGDPSRPSYSDPGHGQGQPGQPGAHPAGAYQGGQSAGGQYGGGQYGGAQGNSPMHALGKGVAVAALVFGIIAFLLGLVPFLAAILGFVAVICGIVALRKVSKGTGAGRGLAITGLVLGLIALVFNLVASVALMSWVGEFVECGQLPTDAQRQQCIVDRLDEQGIDTTGVDQPTTRT